MQAEKRTEIRWKNIALSTVEMHEIQFRNMRVVVWRRKDEGIWKMSVPPMIVDQPLEGKTVEEAKRHAVVALKQFATCLCLKVQILGKLTEKELQS